jgi:hypothetical protein
MKRIDTMSNSVRIIHPDGVTQISSRCIRGIEDTNTIPELIQQLKTKNPPYCLNTNNESQNIGQCTSINSALTVEILRDLKSRIEVDYTTLINYCERILESEKDGALQLLKKTPEDYNEERKIYLERASYAKSWNSFVVILQLIVFIMIILTIGYIRMKAGMIDYKRIGLSLIIPLIIFLYGWFFISGYTIS